MEGRLVCKQNGVWSKPHPSMMAKYSQTSMLASNDGERKRVAICGQSHLLLLRSGRLLPVVNDDIVYIYIYI